MEGVGILVLYMIWEEKLQPFTTEYDKWWFVINSLYYVMSPVYPLWWKFLLWMDIKFDKMLFMHLLDDKVIFIFLFVNVVYHNDYVEPSLWLWSELNLIIVYDPFYVLLDLVCLCFVEDFCIYIHQGYWLESFFLFLVALSGFHIVVVGVS